MSNELIQTTLLSLDEREANILEEKKTIRESEAKEIYEAIQKILDTKKATIVPIFQIVGNQIISSWNINFPT